MTLKKEKEFHDLPKGLNTSQIRRALEAILSRAANSKANSLFADAPNRILLDVTAHRIPDGQNHFFNIVLPHSPHPPSPDILLVIPDDLKSGADADPDIPVNQMKDRLREAGVKIREVMTLKQCRDDFHAFEAKRALAKRIDLVVADIPVFKCLSSVLGREFYRRKKFALGVDLEKAENLSETFEFTLKKTVFNISTKGPTSSIVVGSDNLTVEELVENVCKIGNWIMRTYPGGWDNISKLSLYVAGILPIVIYFSKGSRNDIKKATTRGKPLPAPEEDELSTIPGSRVRVHAGGNIEVLKEELDESDEEIINNLGVDKEIKDERFGKVKKGDSGRSVNDVEEQYLVNVSKTQAFEQIGKKRKKEDGDDDQQVPRQKKQKKEGNQKPNQKINVQKKDKSENSKPTTDKLTKKKKQAPEKKMKAKKSNFA